MLNFAEMVAQAIFGVLFFFLFTAALIFGVAWFMEALMTLLPWPNLGGIFG